MELNTASAVISLAREMEEASAGFYEALAKQQPASQEMLLGYARENRKFAKQVQTAYYGVITDAIEGCYAFKIDTDNYKINTDLADGTTIAAAAKQALEIEDGLARLYTDAAAQSQGLLADVPRAFTLITKKRAARRPQLEALG